MKKEEFVIKFENDIIAGNIEKWWILIDLQQKNNSLWLNNTGTYGYMPSKLYPTEANEYTPKVYRLIDVSMILDESEFDNIDSWWEYVHDPKNEPEAKARTISLFCKINNIKKKEPCATCKDEFYKEEMISLTLYGYKQKLDKRNKFPIVIDTRVFLCDSCFKNNIQHLKF